MDLSTGGQTSTEHVLLTVLGTNPSKARYALEDRQTDARIAPIALFNLLPESERPDRVLALCTTEARRDTWPLLENDLGKRCQTEPIDIAGETQDGVNTFLQTVTGAIPEDVDLTVDVTHGFRHFSFLTYLAVLYLAALRRVKIRGAYYGMLNPHPTHSPFLDLRPLLDLPRWVHALEVLRETGSTLPIANLLSDGPDSEPARDNVRDLTALSGTYLSGLPLELGWQVRNFLKFRPKPLRRLLRRGHRLPLTDDLVKVLSEIVEPFALADRPRGQGWKNQIRITKSELQRQVRIIDDLLDHGSFATAVGLMREWTVSWVIWRWGDEGDWLSRNVRRDAETRLHAIRAIEGDQELAASLSDEQRKVGRFWKDLAEVRNAYAHHGMRGDDLVRDRQVEAARNRVLEVWKETLHTCPNYDLSIGDPPGGRVLVTPIGMRPGVLFSAVQACRAHGDRTDPARCLVICSPETEGFIAQATQRANYRGAVELLRFEDAFGGGSDAIRRLTRPARRHFIGITEVLVNVTGGTTLMGLAAEELAGEARSLACAVSRFGLIDRRPPARQDADPYQAGEPFWLNAEKDEDGD